MKNDETLWWEIILLFYLLIVGIGAAVLLISNFPDIQDDQLVFPRMTGDKIDFFPFGVVMPASGLIILAFLSGVAGSFLHAAQSLGSYIGNSAFKLSWIIWYILRPWIGGILGLAIYFVFRAGLVGGGSVVNVNPYGVVALGLLGGWFSKTTTDKLQEVFETLFKTDEDKKRKDKLLESDRPQIYSVYPSPIPTNRQNLILVGTNFKRGATVLIDGQELTTNFLSETQLDVSLERLSSASKNGNKLSFQVKNLEGREPLSNSITVNFQSNEV